MQTRTFKTAGNLDLEVDVHGADSPGETRKPVLVFIHGGALIMGSRGWLAPEPLERYLDAGLAVVSIDYRLAPETKLAAIAEDVEDAFAWVRGAGTEEFGFDPDCIGVVGHSAGGYLALLAGYRVKPAPNALVAFYGYGDVVGDWYSKPDPFYRTFDLVTETDAHRAVGDLELTDGAADPARWDFYLWCRQNGLWPEQVSGHDPIAEVGWFMPYSPAENVTSDYPPTLLLHGEADTDVPYAQSVLMAERLAGAGVDHEFITIPGGHHGFDHDPETATRADVTAAFGRVIDFLSERI